MQAGSQQATHFLQQGTMTVTRGSRPRIEAIRIRASAMFAIAAPQTLAVGNKRELMQSSNGYEVNDVERIM